MLGEDASVGRSIMVGVGAALLSCVLLCLSVVAMLSWTRAGHLARDPQVLSKDSGSIKKEYGDPLALLNSGKKVQETVVFPLISLATAIMVGLMEKTRAGWIAVVTLLPLQFLALASNSFAPETFVRTVAYLLLA